MFPFSFLIILLYKSEGFSIIMCVAYYYSSVSVAINLFCLSFPKVLNCEYYYLRLWQLLVKCISMRFLFYFLCKWHNKFLLENLLYCMFELYFIPKHSFWAKMYMYGALFSGTVGICRQFVYKNMLQLFAVPLLITHMYMI